MAGSLTFEVAAPNATIPSAAVWLDDRRAIVAEVAIDGTISTCEITRGWLAERAFLAQVVRVIGDRLRVLILGPSTERLLVEREYVATFRRPDRLVDVEPAGPISSKELVDRLRAFAA
jgi:hypothetical protein